MDSDKWILTAEQEKIDAIWDALLESPQSQKFLDLLADEIEREYRDGLPKTVKTAEMCEK
jgi:hypothetical protein